MNPITVLAVGAHPDDVEILCAGTLLLLRRAGHRIHVATLTLGDCGSRQIAPNRLRAIRRGEAEAACRRLGAGYGTLGFDDFAIFNDDASNRRVTALVREVNPALVITHPPHDYISDHEATSRLVRNACFYASAPNYDAGTPAPATASIASLLYAAPLGGTDIFGAPVPQAIYVDVSDCIDDKSELLACHASQREWLRAQHGMDEYIESMRRANRELGAAAAAPLGRDIPYAEGFRQHLGHPYPTMNLLAHLLPGYVVAQTNQKS